MNSREKKMALVLGILVGTVALFVFWQMVLVPWLDSREAAQKLRDEFAEKQKKLDDLQKKKTKLDSYRKRSLPGEPTVAKTEYEAMLSEVLREAKVPNGYTLDPKSAADESKTPILTSKTHLAYQRVAYTIVLHKVDMPTLLRFMMAYYRQPVLQQITHFTVKRAGSEEASSSTRSSSRSDLEVTIQTEGMILDGVEKRKTLIPVSVAFGAMGGNAGLELLNTGNPALARRFTPAGTPSLLAPGNRDYALIAAKDPFHGPLPELKRPDPPKTTEEVKSPPPPPKFDMSPFVRLNGITWRGNGTATAEIHDAAHQMDYLVEYKSNLTGDMVIAVKKFYYLNGERRPLESFDDLVIAEDDSATDRHFKVLEFSKQERGLILRETPLAKDAFPADEPAAAPAPPAEDKKPTGKNTGKAPVGKTTKKPEIKKGPQAAGALMGAFPFVPNPPQPKTFIWRSGTPLSQIEELKTATEPKKEAAPMPDREGR